MNAIETEGLGKRFARFWALQDVNINIPEGSVSGLVGPNGAGKSTLLHILTGLSTATTGTARVLGRAPSQEGSYVKDIGYLAQEIPLYRRLSADAHFTLCKNTNEGWDEAYAQARMRDLDIPLNKPVGKLSGGQRAQVGLALALAKHPRVLMLDEPVAALDPLARRDFLTALSTAVAEDGLTVIMSSHLVADLERVCDHLVLVSASRVQLCSPIDTLLEQHRVLIGPRQDESQVANGLNVIHAMHTPRQTTLLVRMDDVQAGPPWTVESPTFEELVLGYMEAES